MPYEKGLYVMNVHSPLRAIAQIDKNPFLFNERVKNYSYLERSTLPFSE